MLIVITLSGIGCNQAEYNRGYNSGTLDGYNKGYREGMSEGCTLGESEGYVKGYSVGIESVAPEKRLHPYDLGGSLTSIIGIICYFLLAVVLLWIIIITSVEGWHQLNFMGRTIPILLGIGASFVIFRIANVQYLATLETSSVGLIVLFVLIFFSVSGIIGRLMIIWFRDLDEFLPLICTLVLASFLLSQLLFLMSDFHSILIGNPQFSFFLIAAFLGLLASMLSKWILDD